MPRAAATKPAQLVPAEQVSADQLAAFFRKVWDDNATAEGVARARAEAAKRNVAEPGVEPPTFVFLHQGDIVGYVTSIPTRVSQGGGERAAYWVKGLMVLPEHRNGPVGFALMKEYVKRVPCALSLTVSSGSRRLFEALGFANLGMLPNHVRVLDAAGILKKFDLQALGISSHRVAAMGLSLVQKCRLTGLAGLVATAAIRLRTAAPPASAKSLRLGTEMPTREEVDGLWRRVRGSLGAVPLRDGGYVAGRYPSSAYTVVTARDGGELAGFMAIRKPRGEGDPRLRGIRIATISDALYAPERAEVGAALLRASEHAARDMGSDAVLCSSSSPALEKQLERRAYVRAPENTYFLHRSPKDSGLPTQLADWWLTRGDMNADEVF